MLDQARIWGILEHSLRECAGMLRRRMPAPTVFGVLALCGAFLFIGADAFAARDATALAILAALIATFWVLKSRRLRLGRRLGRRVAPSKHRVERSVDRGVRRFGRYYPLHEAQVESFAGFDGFPGQDEPARATGSERPRQ